jgi:hypothetical protein
MVWALTLPVCILVGLFQYGVITGNNLLAFFGGEKPYFVLSILMYIPIGILSLSCLHKKGLFTLKQLRQHKLLAKLRRIHIKNLKD